ncbi:coiled-coil domain-containing protein 38-like [Trematomus bernacchii]|uniref:coiled-coil domain-containing protein 38-like n=1 Tax=Trematomus bernacchii TaxID=40690 RepID=UPI00146AC0D4|nr:coiled-coil domain-containing protein 38-like [Trematomus bernacchii]
MATAPNLSVPPPPPLQEHVVSSEPHQILDLVTDFTDQVLSLTRISNWVDEPLKELMQDIETTSRKMEEDDKKLTLQLGEMKDRIVSDLERAATLKKKVQLHDSLKTEDHDTMSDALGVKITEVHRCCVDSRMTYLSTLEKLTSVEYRISLLFQFLESIPKENLKTLRLIKDNDRRGRLREEQLRLEKEKHLEMLKKCKLRSMDGSKKKARRKLMPRCFPVEQKIRVSEEDNLPAEEELHAFLFTTEDDE